MIGTAIVLAFAFAVGSVAESARVPVPSPTIADTRRYRGRRRRSTEIDPCELPSWPA